MYVISPSQPAPVTYIAVVAHDFLSERTRITRRALIHCTPGIRSLVSIAGICIESDLLARYEVRIVQGKHRANATVPL